MAAEVTSTATESPAGTGASRRGRRTSAMKSWIGAASGSWKNSTSCGYAQPASRGARRAMVTPQPPPPPQNVRPPRTSAVSPRPPRRVWVEIMGSQECRTVRKSQSILIMINPMIFSPPLRPAQGGVCMWPPLRSKPCKRPMRRLPDRPRPSSRWWASPAAGSAGGGSRHRSGTGPAQIIDHSKRYPLLIRLRLTSPPPLASARRSPTPRPPPHQLRRAGGRAPLLAGWGNISE